MPAIINTTSFLYCISSNSADSGDIKLGFISKGDPRDIFQTFIFLFASTIFLIFLTILDELFFPLIATPKCFTLNLPQPSSKSGLIVGPSTIIEDTAVPCI